ncbi:thioredoxin domain-containing protein [Leptobacterium sp. I13]|uniref:thioredoxin domain-containing protein n=1 Tax=Leptobacterium meishanense TaxID=3128904 RepID=UPI0030EDFD2B
MKPEFTNSLIHETSPYLLQHAYNPVDWLPWGEEALHKAKSENKPLLISIGYAACHWCHVMEKESFEDEEVAKLMNEYFINVKVDREERPDVDQIYMDAVQLMTNGGGWPLNVVAMPDGRPFWGGTYFPKEDWMNSLKQLSLIYKESPEKVITYADNLQKGIEGLHAVIPPAEKTGFSNSELKTAVENWSKYFDYKNGGITRVPKFMMPVNLQFLLRHATAQKDAALLAYVETTLTKIAYGGVYDHIGGGFARYAVDKKWHVPHFEKMLYDNAQLVSLYSNAYAATKNELYKKVVIETLAFVERELMSGEFAFYSSLDADSYNEKNELEEGAFYVWNKETLQKLIKDDYEVFSNYYNINDYGYWEHNNYVLIRDQTDEELAKKHQTTPERLRQIIEKSKKVLFKEREKRSQPRLDDKSLTSWNALMLKAYVDAYKIFGDDHYLDIAIKNAHFLLQKQLREDGGLNHNYKKGKSTINGYLEDYATLADAYIALYEVTLDDTWLHTSKSFVNYCFDHFFDDTSKLFYFTSNEDDIIVVRGIEKADNVIPASNSIMGKVLFKLSHYYDNKKYKETAEQMLHPIRGEFLSYGSSYANWMNLMLDFTNPFYEVAVVGENAKDKIDCLNQYYLPNKIIAGSTKPSKMSLLRDRYTTNKTFMYVCVNNSCKLPVTEVSEALKLMD